MILAHEASVARGAIVATSLVASRHMIAPKRMRADIWGERDVERVCEATLNTACNFGDAMLERWLAKYLRERTGDFIRHAQRLTVIERAALRREVQAIAGQVERGAGDL